jgi:hypothetical protein
MAVWDNDSVVHTEGDWTSVNTSWYNLVRVFFIIVPHSLMFFATGAVLSSYWKIYLTERKISKIDRNPIYGLLPKHVAGITISTLIMSAGIVLDTVGRLDTHFTWRLLPFSVSGIVGCWSLYQVLRFDRLRYEHFHG